MEELPANEYSFDFSLLDQDDDLLEGWLNDYPTDSASSDAESRCSRNSDVPSPALSEEGTANFCCGVNDKELLQLSVKDLNSLVRKLPKDAVRAIKKRRRTLKNRGYAYSCRQKRLEEKSQLETSKGMLEHNYATIEHQLKKVKVERDDYKRRYENLFRLILAHGGATVQEPIA